ncbi:MAG: hypothetical protein PF689_08095 [Deltaproteobacteria bacterium]|nr:hypothetical protein [Deltaproteobacteria bacterium]
MSVHPIVVIICAFFLFLNTAPQKVFANKAQKPETVEKTKEKPVFDKNSFSYKSKFAQGVFSAGFGFSYSQKNLDYELESGDEYDFDRKISTMGFSANLSYFIVESLSLFTDFSYSSYDQQQDEFGYRIVEATISGGLNYYHLVNPKLFLISGVGFYYHHRNTQDLSIGNYYGGLLDLSIGVPLNSYFALIAGCRFNYLFGGEAEESSFNSAKLSGFGFEGKVGLQIFF